MISPSRAILMKTSSRVALLVRATGPALAGFGVTGALADPVLRIFSNGVVVAENDNWIGNEESYTTANWPSMFDVPNGSRDAILSLQLPPGSYTAQVSGVANTTGVALVEVYEVP